VRARSACGGSVASDARHAGGLATLVTHPPDVMRTRLQLRRHSLLANGGPLVRSCARGGPGMAACASAN
jgi:hypothetical protein